MRFTYLLLIRYLHAPLLYPEGLVVLRDHTNYVFGVATTVYQREQGPRRFGQKLDSEDSEERSRRGYSRDPLACREGPRLSMELLDWELSPYEGLQEGLGGSLCAS